MVNIFTLVNIEKREKIVKVKKKSLHLLTVTVL